MTRIIVVIWFFLSVVGAVAQPISLNKRTFFDADTAKISLYLTTHFKGIQNKNAREIRRPAHARLVYSNQSSFEGDIEIRARGDFRFDLCTPPPLMLHFKTEGAGPLAGLGKMKMVWPCKIGDYYQQLVLKEYLAYRFYNLITPYSFRVRRLDVHYADSLKPDLFTTVTAFLLEDVDDMAKRLGCRELEGVKTVSAQVERETYTLMTIFQYMIGNTDWGVPNYHNIKLIQPTRSETAPPYAIPYDLDFCGLVNANYASPPDMFPIEHVKERMYMGVLFEEPLVVKALDIFIAKKEDIMREIEHCEGLELKVKRETEKYISEFYDIISKRSRALEIFKNPPGM